MGAGHAKFTSYDDKLLHDHHIQTFQMDDPNRKQDDKGFFTSTKIIRNISMKESGSGFAGFLDDPAYTADKDEKTEDATTDEVGGQFPMVSKGKLSTGWKIWQSTSNTKENQEKPGFGTRTFAKEEEKQEFDPTKRGDYMYENFKSCYDQTLNVGLGLRHGLKTFDNFELPNYSNIGIFSKNRAEWMITHLGNWSQSYRTVALYDTLGFESVKYIVGHAELAVIFVEKDKLSTLFKAIEANNEDKKSDDPDIESFDLKLKFVVQFDFQEKYYNKHENVEQSDIDKAKALGLDLVGFSDLVEGKLVSQLKDVDCGQKEENEPFAKDLAYIMYTSGTTGTPKGVQLSHRAFACVVASSTRSFLQYPALNESEWSHVSFLPLAHSFEAAVISVVLSHAGKVSFFNGNIKLISQDWKDVKPTLMFGVPRIYNRTYDKVMAGMDSAHGAKKFLVGQAKSKSFAQIKQGRRSVLFDKLVWHSVAEKIGFEDVKLLASGAAPLSPNVAEFLRVACKGAAIVQGYGMTETTAISFFTGLEDLNLGHVGVPVDNIEFRMIDVPDKEYFVEPRNDEEKEGFKKETWFPRGEIQMRGPTVMDGYFKNEDATKGCLSEDGWLSTGDIGRLNPNGTLSIVDRAKAIFKLERGEYISPEKVENTYGSCCKSIGQIMVTGNSNLERPVALIVPSGEWLQYQFEHNNGNKVKGCDIALKSDWKEEDNNLTLASAEWVDRINKISKENEEWIRYAVKEEIESNMMLLKEELRFEETVADIDIEVELDQYLQGFSVAKNTLTPSFKLKRKIIEVKYKEKLNAMYEKMIEDKKNKLSEAKKTVEKAMENEENKQDDNDVTTNVTKEEQNEQNEAPKQEEDATTTQEEEPPKQEEEPPKQEEEPPKQEEDAPKQEEDAPKQEEEPPKQEETTNEEQNDNADNADNAGNNEYAD